MLLQPLETLAPVRDEAVASRTKTLGGHPFIGALIEAPPLDKVLFPATRSPAFIDDGLDFVVLVVVPEVRVIAVLNPRRLRAEPRPPCLALFWGGRTPLFEPSF